VSTLVKERFSVSLPNVDDETDISMTIRTLSPSSVNPKTSQQMPGEPDPVERTIERPVPAQFQRRQVTQCLCCGSSQRDELFQHDGYHLQRCKKCHLAYLSDPPTDEELQRFYSFASNYHSDFATSPQAREEFIKRGGCYLTYLSRYARSGRLLDVGCSAGFFMKVARDQGWDVSGLEYSSDSAQLGRDLYDFNIQIGALSSHHYQPNSFDAVTLWDVIEHLPDPLESLRQALELLVPGGHIALSTPNIDGLFPRLSYLPGKLLNYWPHPAPPAHLSQFSVRTLGRMLKRAGFEVVCAETRRIPLDYSFGSVRELLRMPKRLVYAAVFAPVALIAPWIGQGDEVVMIARKPTFSKRSTGNLT